MLAVLLVSSTIIAASAQSSNSSTYASSSSNTNWLPGGNYPFNWNYNPQTTINASNVQNLAISWVYPMPAAPAPYQADEGVIEPVLVYQGISYFITDWHRVYALSASDGNILWYKTLPVNLTEAGTIQTEGNGHYHEIWISTHILNEPLIWVAANDFHIFALNALTGDITIEFQPMNASLMAPGATRATMAVMTHSETLSLSTTLEVS